MACPLRKARTVSRFGDDPLFALRDVARFHVERRDVDDKPSYLWPSGWRCNQCSQSRRNSCDHGKVNQ